MISQPSPLTRRRPGAALRRTRQASTEPDSLRLAFLNESRPPNAVRNRDRAFRYGVIAADIVAAMAVVVLCHLVMPASHLSWTLILLPLLVPVVNAPSGLYRRDAVLLNKNTLDEAPAVLGAATITTVVAYLAASAILAAPIGAQTVAFVWGGLTISVLTSRVAARALIQRVLPPERCMVIGDRSDGRRLAAKLGEAAGLKSELVATVPLSVTGAGNHERRSDARFTSFAATVRELDVHRVLIAAGAAAPEEELEAIQAAKALGIKVSVLPRVLEVVGSSAVYDSVDGLTVLGVPRFGISRSSEVVKRTFDLVGALTLLLLASPVFLTIAVAVRLSGPGPIFFRQQRIGRSGLSFSMLKFRSMHADAEQLKDSLRDRNEQDGGLFKIADDPRITPVGKWLRRSSLDELPQLINVLLGDMSMASPPAASDAGHDRPLAGARLVAHPAPGDGDDRLPLRRQLVALERREDPAAHGQHGPRAAWSLTPARSGVPSRVAAASWPAC
jgi:hypothetical protein